MIKITKKTSYSSFITIKNKKLKNSRGFTLIELMITVAIVGILAAVALPAYQDYVARSQVSEGLVLVSGAKPVIAEYYSNHGSYPSASDIGFNGYVGSYVGTTTIGADGAIVATFSDDAHRQLRGQTVTLTPEEVDETGNLKWNCSSSVDSKFLPTSCTNDGSTGNPTNPGNGGTVPTEPPFDPNFTATFNIMGINYTYENGVLTRFNPATGNVGYGSIASDDGLIFPAGSTLGFDSLKMDKYGNIVTEKAVVSSSGITGTITNSYMKGGSIEGNMQLLEQTYTAGGTTFSIMSPTYVGSSYPSYIINNPTPYSNYISAFNNLRTGNVGNDINVAPTQTQVDNYNNALNEYVSFLNQQKSSGQTLTDLDELILKKQH